MQRARLVFSLPLSLLSAVHGALLPETRLDGDDAAEAPSSAFAKSRSRVDMADEGLVLLLEADDIATLRAAVNSHLRWIDAAAKAAALAR